MCRSEKLPLVVTLIHATFTATSPASRGRRENTWLQFRYCGRREASLFGSGLVVAHPVVGLRREPHHGRRQGGSSAGGGTGARGAGPGGGAGGPAPARGFGADARPVQTPEVLRVKGKDFSLSTER